MRILVVEDDPIQADWITESIELAFVSSECEVISTEYEFRSLFDNIAASPPDIVIMDFMLQWTRPAPSMQMPPPEVRNEPYRAGIRCCELLIQDERTRKVPVVLYTVLLQQDVQPLPNNAVYLQKNISTSKLLNQIRPLWEKIGAKEERKNKEQIAIALFGNKIKIVSLNPEGTYRVLDEADNLHRILYVASVEPLALENAVAELESLINDPQAKEADFQDFFERYPDFILNDQYKKAHPHITLTREGNSLIPDFVLEPFEQNSLCDLLELKLPSTQAFILKKNRARLSAAVMEACAQLRTYSIYFDEEQNRKFVQEKYGLLAYRPKMFVVIGRRGNLNPIEAKRMTNDLPNLHLVTYDEVMTRMKVKIDRMKRGDFR